MRSHPSLASNLDQLSGQPEPSEPRVVRLAKTANTLGAQLAPKNRELLARLTSNTKPELRDIRALLITGNTVSSAALLALNASIQLRANQLQAERYFSFSPESKPVDHYIIQPMDDAKKILAEIYREKYGIDLFVETITLELKELTELLKQKLDQPGNAPVGLILHSPPNKIGTMNFAETVGNYAGHVTPFIVQKTPTGFDIMCLDSVAQPDWRIFKCCEFLANEGYEIRTVRTNTIRQTDGYSCHTDALQILKDLLLDYKSCQCNLLDMLNPGSITMPSTLNPVAPTLQQPLALDHCKALEKTTQRGQPKTINTKYMARFDSAPDTALPRNQFLLLKGYYNALKVLHAVKKKAP